ncbi:hypothetical protein JK635_01840 [Neobacillus sp. YIM B02564]|uniref:Uncharacterized protein n=1 Tax=Neobacillus paridis TaxID=2803862 RepID=A0ABS1TI29_9BACI|nr:hypothetical protein [Neobacillus paridis]MBL4950980.1 hypothetical protein [Neobacillus paridis]
MKRKRYTKDDLINIIKNFYIENNKIPSAEDFKSSSPSTSTFYRHFKSWEDALVSSGFKRTSKNIEHSKVELIDLLKKYYHEFNEVPTAKGLESKENYPSYVPYFKKFGSLKNALIEAGLFELRADKHNFDRDKTFSKEDCLHLLDEYIKRNNRIPTINELKDDKNMPSDMRYYNLFGGLNNALSELGYDPINIGKYSDENLISKLIQLYNDINKVPTCSDIDNCEYTPYSKCYTERFGSLYVAYDLAEIPYDISIKQIDDETIIHMWNDLKNNLQRTPTIRDIENCSFDFSNAIRYRWGSYAEFLIDMGEEQNYNKYNCRYYFSDKGKLKCSSYEEYVITNYLEDNDIIFSKEKMYKDVIKEDTTMRRFDWVITYENKTYYVEYFGMTGMEEYDKKAKQKIEDCNKNNINLVTIYPKDLKLKSFDEIFSFLQVS